MDSSQPSAVRPVPYGDILAVARESPTGDVAAFLREELPYCWQDRYLALSAGRPTQPLSFRYGSFDYLCDVYQEPGGAVDGNEANVFKQLGSVNRGGYRMTELYCSKNPGVTCFSRPIYGDTSAHPVRVEFGVLRVDGVLWLRNFPNRPNAEPVWEALL
ncbi:hypothetical protein [Ramlibacter sp.]|uniref:hypothetical protein n=1 Tax=Ramlibacter sp. TaxID=1917967 RepID=UPI0017A79825|nr:hypothetical protein [Ramlibacter sp.]MBA2675437.1 hypothetical protein [Ramlibacter sp.]